MPAKALWTHALPILMSWSRDPSETGMGGSVWKGILSFLRLHQPSLLESFGGTETANKEQKPHTCHRENSRRENNLMLSSGKKWCISHTRWLCWWVRTCRLPFWLCRLIFRVSSTGGLSGELLGWTVNKNTQSYFKILWVLRPDFFYLPAVGHALFWHISHLLPPFTLKGAFLLSACRLGSDALSPYLSASFPATKLSSLVLETVRCGKGLQYQTLKLK